MCLILFAHQASARYRLVLAANRDEFFDRPAAPAQWWPDRPDVLGGRDLSKGGTWLGVTRSGRWSAVTNFREGVRPDPALRSRGFLTAEFLAGQASAEVYASELSGQLSDYAGFNLLVGDGASVWYLGNRPPDVRAVPAGVHGLSNHLLNSQWPKVREGRAGLAALLDADEEKLVAGLFNVLSDRQRAADAELPDSGVGLEWERVLSAKFIVREGYGTRASTVVLIRADGSLRFEERTFAPEGKALSETRFECELSAAV
jgi:uncharacterized protein with NRDE domain